MNRKHIVLIIVLIVALGAITYFFVSKNSPAPATAPVTTNPPPQQPVVPGNNPVAPNKATIETIKTGTSFGMCAGYCVTELVINSKSIIYIRSGDERPEVKNEISLPPDKWNVLVNALDIKKFNLLPEKIGCPDCADGGAEWIEINDGKTIKKVTFEYGASISEIDPLRKILSEVREDVSSQFDK